MNKFSQFSVLFLQSLGNSDVITRQISDHHPVIHHDALFWNVMMPGKARFHRETKEVIGFNNGFAIIDEKEEQYLERIHKMGTVIAEIIFRNPSIKIIGLCEGPVEEKHLQVLFDSLNRFPFMRKFLGESVESSMHTVHKSEGPNWGLLMLHDQTAFTAATPISDLEEEVLSEKESIKRKLTNRFQLWSLTPTSDEDRHSHGAGAGSAIETPAKVFGLAHFPFAGDEEKASREELSADGKVYGELVTHALEKYEDTPLTFCGDFNLNPFLLSQAFTERAEDCVPIHNSILFLLALKATLGVTVDGILLSRAEKQRYRGDMPFLGLTAHAKKEWALLKDLEKAL